MSVQPAIDSPVRSQNGTMLGKVDSSGSISPQTLRTAAFTSTVEHVRTSDGPAVSIKTEMIESYSVEESGSPEVQRNSPAEEESKKDPKIEGRVLRARNGSGHTRKPSLHMKLEPRRSNSIKTEQDDIDDLSPSSLPRTPIASGSALLDDDADDSPDDSVGLSRRSRKGKMPSVTIERQIVWDFPLAEAEALETFEILDDCKYASKAHGASGSNEEEQSCECDYEHGLDAPSSACGTNCINRLTQVECVPGSCRCGKYCTNRRFQRKQYANIQIVDTGMKGFGVRAAEDMLKDAFVYEYIGEVVGAGQLQKRMKDYYEEGIEHFYFMALQREEFIDATKKGNKGRFLNHSCSPNCYVSKWVVGEKMRMGIFTKRKIQAGEELTFNYNVDRYGHEAQPCYCGEANCVGFIGGKTQTDLAGMDQLYLDALGISDEVEHLGLKGSKKKRGSKLDEDYKPIILPIHEDEVARVATAVRQASTNKNILSKIINRIKITQDQHIQRQIMRLHGFSLMNGVLNEYHDDPNLVKEVLEILTRWPLLKRNKVDSTKIDQTVQRFVHSEDETVKILSTELLSSWEELEVAYRIPKGLAESADALMRTSAGDTEVDRKRKSIELDKIFAQAKRQKVLADTGGVPESWNMKIRERTPEADRRPVERATPLRKGWEFTVIDRGDDRPEKRYFYVNDPTQKEFSQIPADAAEYEEHIEVRLRRERVEEQRKREAEEAERRNISNIISAARTAKQADDQTAAEIAAATSAAEAAAKLKAKPIKIVDKDTRVRKLLGNYVVELFNKYRKNKTLKLNDAEFKKYAKHITDAVFAKEKRSDKYATTEYTKLPPHKEKKVKEYVQSWIKRRHEEQKAQKHRATAASVSSASSASQHGGATLDEAADAVPVINDAECDGEPVAGSPDSDLDGAQSTLLGGDVSQPAHADVDGDDLDGSPVGSGLDQSLAA
ncbi:uncharacterized protein L969DRAFT_606822 [Mixia osmundae IAM 14324]|uniref:Histone-lysine N-methyltransferase, H3 lysine-36 specific n=1 Tax=Mixia osmundae (strain CBS 9802 / IAM 14324 / JCM 22182 / KY 12970) TaxID=764103 RepID=G7E366_MIXOS|nr:uncharacterized protein L969DRAFT_606822 [Mixia osmundae IAM 14324]KEI42464.1 hypothetical protein L969DRAFT_606822 [Mixia osmundae IAM 14324]GAA97247.1 hypothetical protein E5Q_03924 [Mixia osmundae IAM 14324]